MSPDVPFANSVAVIAPVCREIQRLLKAWSEAAPKLEPKIRAFVGQLHPMGALANALALALVRPHDYRKRVIGCS